ncbi:MAG: glutamate--cysteine ligase [Thermodesulfobacteriota bacterium]
MPDHPIASKEELARFFTDAFKPMNDWRMGIEFEKLGVNPATGKALPFSGPGGVEEVLSRLAEGFGWAPCYKDGRLLELEREACRITLEPGAQCELSGAPHRTLHEMAAEVKAHLEELRAVSDPDRETWIGFGNQPVSEWKDMELLPKKRYHIMTRYLPSKGELGLAMMRETAATQLNLDYRDEQDAMEKFRLSMALSPLLTALYANSCISGGRANGFLTRRAYIWQHTDPARCGFIERLYHSDAGFSDYVEYALDVPMLFVERDGKWIEIAGAITFRQYMESGHQAYRPTWDDWLLHLSTIFTESRFKPYLEVRGADCPLPGMEMTFPALVKGILYDPQAREEAWDIVQPWSEVARRALYLTISRKGPEARIDGSTARERIVELVRTSRDGLKRQNQRNAEGQDESVYLEPLEERLREGWHCPAKEILALWKGPWKRDVTRLIEHCRF